MAYELIIIGGGIIFGLIGFIIGALLVRRAYKQSPSLNHYQKIIDILTLRKLRNKSDGLGDTISGKSLKTGKDHIEHYEEIRDKLTIRKKPEIVESGGSFLGGIGLGNIVGGFIVILIGVSLLPTIAKQVGNAQAMNVSSNAAQSMGSVLSLIPVFFAIAVIGMGIALTYNFLRNVGMV